MALLLKYSMFVINEELARKIKGSFGGAEAGKTASHVRAYIMPFLSAKQKAESKAKLEDHMDTSKIKEEDGEHHSEDPDETTHTLGTKVGSHPAGTQVKVTGAHVKDGKLHVSTAKHGDLPASALNVPENLKRTQKASTGFKVENSLASNLGTKAAGSTGAKWDFSYGGGSNVKKPKVTGKVVQTESDETAKKPELRGESKILKGKMGQGVLAFDHGSRTWKINHPNKEVADHMAKATVNGVPILDHLNKHHPDGKIENGFSADAHKGMSRAYLKSTDTNALHIHNDKENHGTTFTYGDNNSLHGKTHLGHLSNDDLDRLDGKISVEATKSGNTTIIHRPKQLVMREFSNKSKEDSNHRDLTNPAHAEEFKQHIDKLAG